MPITVLPRKTRVPELVAELFHELPETERNRASIALMAANPHFGRRVNLPAGTVVVVPPEAAALRPPAERDDEDKRRATVTPIDAMDEAIKKLAEQLEDALVTAQRDLESARTVTKSREVREIVHQPEVARLLEHASTATKERDEELKATRRFLSEELPRVREGLESLRARLR